MTEHEITFNEKPLVTNSFVFTVSREQLLDMGQIEPTPEELAERNESSRVFHEKQKAKRSEFLNALDLLAMSGGLVKALLDLHMPDLDEDFSVECPGCDVSGYEGEQPEWPCRTVRVLANASGVALPDGDLPGRHYEGEFVPSDGRAIDWSSIYRPMWHAVGDAMDRDVTH